MTASILLVGESPPPGAALDFTPFDCASGTRLATIMLGLHDRATMLAHVPRANIYDTPTGAKGCDAVWNPDVARALGNALLISREYQSATTIVALGRRTAEALGMPDALRVPSLNWSPPLCATWTRGPAVGTRIPTTIMYAPHPSGASSTLNDPSVRADVRAMLMPEIILGIPTLRPWHFRLEDAGVLAALAAAVSPLCPALGAAALVYADGMHRASQARTATPLLARLAPASDQPLVMLDTVIKADASWDEPMSRTAATLLTENGARVLARRWAPTDRVRGDAWLANAAKAHVALNAQPRAVMRATLARYAAGGLL